MMQTHSEWLVGGLAIAMSGWLSWNAVVFAPWLYGLHSVASVQHRFGRRAACGLALGVAVMLLAMGVMILSGVRPAYAVPDAAVEADAASGEP